MTDRLTVRAIQISDAERLAEIYSYYVNDTAVSFEYEAPSTDEFARRIGHTTEKYDFLRTKSEIIRKNPASPDTPTSKPVVWSITILVFLMKNKNLSVSGLREGQSGSRILRNISAVRNWKRVPLREVGTVYSN